MNIGTFAPQRVPVWNCGSHSDLHLAYHKVLNALGA